VVVVVDRWKVEIGEGDRKGEEKKWFRVEN
jgi:hypothetical protein